MKLLYKIIGIASFAVGIVGAFIPLLPTTCFILLAAWCFSKSSPKFHAALKQNRVVGGVITHWEQHHSIPIGAQRIAIGSMLISGALCLLIFDKILIQLFALMFISVGVWYVSQIPITKPTKV